MHIFETQKSLSKQLTIAKQKSLTIGFVPTMGALHEGHLSLIEKSKTQNNIVVVSIFVNPTQFNNPLDLEKYPRTVEADLKKIASVCEDCLIFIPNVAEIYGNLLVSESFPFGSLASQMEGKFRPGHFDGVGTIVKRLFDIVKPDKAYFGEKDFQQLQIIKKLVTIENLRIEIVPCKILREANGLAMSSRNELLSPHHRAEAAFIYETLLEVKKLYETQEIAEIELFVTKKVNSFPSFELEYFQIAAEETLKKIVSKNKKGNHRAFIAVYVNKIRLIDNISLK